MPSHSPCRAAFPAFTSLDTVASDACPQASKTRQRVLLALISRPRARALYLLYRRRRCSAAPAPMGASRHLAARGGHACGKSAGRSCLAAAWVAKALRGVRVIVDWHNLGYSVLQLAVRRANHPFVALSRLRALFPGSSTATSADLHVS